MNSLKYDQLLLSSLNNNEDLHSDSFEYQSIFLSSIKPDPTNGRFLPSIFIDDQHANQLTSRKLSKKQLVKLYNGENFVLIGKSCIINCFAYGSDDWKKANHTINSIVELADNISVSELIQTPTLYPIENNEYQILTGHRRFFALVYAKGYGSTAQFKLYEKQPLLTKIKQFQENASREDLPQYGKLQAFLNARMEIDALNSAKQRIGLKKLTVKEIAVNLGISMGAFDNYNVLTRYPSVQSSYAAGLTLPFIRVKKIVLVTEAAYKAKNNKTVLNLHDRENISEQISAQLSNKTSTPPNVKSFSIKSIKSSLGLQTLLKSNVMELNAGIDWQNIDWQDHASISAALNKLSDFLNTEID
ncbi:MAG: hypothetical protein HRT53_01605 [Colwellia sp.]|nr:hypothetical protein [Colwellia sp.]